MSYQVIELLKDEKMTHQIVSSQILRVHPHVTLFV